MRRLHYVPLVVIGGLLALFAFGCSKAYRKEKLLEQGQAHFQSGDYDHAEIEFLNVLRYEPTNYIALRCLGIMAYEQGKLIRAHGILSQLRKSFPNDLDVHLQYALTLMAAGSPNTARQEAISLLSLQPTNEGALLLLVESSYGPTNLTDAGNRLADLAKVCANSSAYNVALGLWHLRRNEVEPAQKFAHAALSLDPKSSAAHSLAGSLSILRKDTNSALAELKSAAELAPPRSAYYLRYVDFLGSLGDAAGARRELEALCKRVPDYLPAQLRSAQLALADRRLQDAENTLEALLQRDPAHVDAALLMARVYTEQRQYDKAIALLESIVKLFPTQPNTYFQLATVQLRIEDFSGVTKNLGEALRLRPDYPEATMLMAETSLRRGDQAGAIALLTKLVAKYPTLVPAQLLLAGAYRASGNPDAALRIYEAYSRAFPTNPQPHFLMGLVQRQKGERQVARRSFEQSCALARPFYPALEQLVSLDLEERRSAEARDRLNREILSDSNNIAPLLLLARVYLAETNLTAAKDILLQANHVQPESSDVHSLLARTYVLGREHEAALASLQKVVALNTNDTASFMMMGEIYWASSNYVAAARNYRTVLALKPKHVPALNNLAWLSSEFLADPKAAYELASAAHGLDPENPLTSDTFAWVLFRNGDYPRALGILMQSTRAIQDNPLYSSALGEALFHLGSTHYMMGQESAARVALEGALRFSASDSAWKPEAQERLKTLQFDAAKATEAEIKDLQTQSTANPRDPILFVKLGALAESNKKWNQAVAAYESALQVNTNLMSVMLKLARLYSVNPKNPQRALALARRARALETDDPAIAHTLGRLAFDAAQTSQDFQWAYGLLAESSRKLPDDPEVLLDYCLATLSVGDVTNAVRVAERIPQLSAAPSIQAEAQLFLTLSQVLGGANVSAATNVTAILAQRPDYLPALAAYGRLLESNHEYSAAKDVFERLLGLYPAYLPANRALALLYADQLGDPEKAYEHASKAREFFPQDLQVARILGLLSFGRGEMPRAAQLIKEALVAYPQDPRLHYSLGFAQYKLKQPAPCKQSLNQALSLAPDAPEAKEARRILQELK